MHIAVTGSISTDHLMVYRGRFAEHFRVGKMDRISLSFLVGKLDIRRGGAAANVCFGMGALGLRPVLIGTVGHAFNDYRSWLHRHRVDTASVLVSANRFTARFLCTTDDDHNQIASFYPGDMAEAREIGLAPVAARISGLDLVVAPNDPAAMICHTRECRERGYVFAADPPQQLASITRGARIESATSGVRTVPAARAAARREHPTGAGDAFRAGFLAGRPWGLGLDRSVQSGCALASLTLECLGSQEYQVAGGRLLARFAETYGPAAAAEIQPHLAAGPALAEAMPV